MLEQLLKQIKRIIVSINKDECQYSKNLSELNNKSRNENVIIDILNNGYMNHKNMEAVNCILESYLRKHRVITNDGLITPDEIHKFADTNNTKTIEKSINTYIQNIRPLSSGTASSEVYLADLFVNNISLIIKFPNRNDRRDKIEFMKEYIIGKSINKLRQITPCFMYTFSLIGCGLNKRTNKICTTNKSVPLLILEKVNATSTSKFIQEPTTTFEDWLKVYVQVLLNLEIAQKLYKFNHNDLHHENVMVTKKPRPITYSFNSETKTIKVTTDTFPVLIDFGYSGMNVYDEHVKGVDLGQAFPPEFNTCYDMYLHLARCAQFFYIKHQNINHPDVRKVFDLYEFFVGDPYDIFNNNNNLFRNSDYFEQVNYKKTIIKTPGEFLEWIMNKYGNVLSGIITISKRETYINPMSNQYDMYDNFYIAKYHEIIPLKPDSKVISKIVNKFITCTTNQDYQSYITSMQSIKILESMTSNSTNVVVNKAKKAFTDMVSNEKRKNTLIATDLIRLNTFFTNPNFEFIKDVKFDKYRLETIFNSNSMGNKFVNEINNMIGFATHIKPYYNVYLMIKELNLTEYNDWVSKFENSDICKYYEKLADKIDRYNRFIFAVLELNDAGRL